VWCNFEGRVTTAGNLAYPYSPSILDTGPVYRLNVHHLLEAEDPCMFPIKIVEVGDEHTQPASVIRTKNAGPYIITADIIFDDSVNYERVKKSGVISRERVAGLYVSP